MNPSDVNSILANLEEVSILRDVEVKLASLIHRTPLEKRGQHEIFKKGAQLTHIHRDLRAEGMRRQLDLWTQTNVLYVNDTYPAEFLRGTGSSESFSEEELKQLLEWGVDFKLKHVSFLAAFEEGEAALDPEEMRVLPKILTLEDRLKRLDVVHHTPPINGAGGSLTMKEILTVSRQY